MNAINTDRDELLRTLKEIPRATVAERWESGQCAIATCFVPMVAVCMVTMPGLAFPLCIHHLRRVAV